MNQLQKILATSLPICVAGGAIISYIDPTIPHDDFDVYVLHPLWLPAIHTHIQSLGTAHVHKAMGHKVKTYTFEDPTLKPVQVIVGPPSIQGIIKSFDFTCCGVALDTKMTVHAGPFAKDHIDKKALHWNKFISVRHALDRISKYEKKGFTPTKKLLEQLLFNVELPGGIGVPTTFFNSKKVSAVMEDFPVSLNCSWTPAYDV